MNYLHCHSCGKCVSTGFLPELTDTPDRGIIVRAYIECPECLAEKSNTAKGREPFKVQVDPPGQFEREIDPPPTPQGMVDRFLEITKDMPHPVRPWHGAELKKCEHEVLGPDGDCSDCGSYLNPELVKANYVRRDSIGFRRVK